MDKIGAPAANKRNRPVVSGSPDEPAMRRQDAAK